MSRNDLYYAQQAKTLFALPDVYLRLKEIMADEQATLDDIANIIVLDPALTSTLLKLANSAMFNFPRAVDSITKALSILGMKSVCDLINTYGVSATFKDIDNTAINIDKFWEVSVDCALICKFFAQLKKIKNSDGIFVSGLLHNISELVIMQSESKKVSYCLDYDKHETPWQRQKDVFGFTYADCTAKLLTLWQLPRYLIEPIENLHQAYGEEVSEATSILYVASRLALINSHPGMYSKKTFLGQHILNGLNISMTDVEEALNYCNAEGLVIMSALKLKKAS